MNTVVIGKTHTCTHILTDTNMYYPFMCVSNIESHIPRVGLSSQGLYIGQIPQQGKRDDNGPELFTHRETQRDNAKSCYSYILQSDVVMERILNNVLHKFNIHISQKMCQVRHFEF